MGRTRREVGVLSRILLHVEEFDSTLRLFAVLQVGPLLLAQEKPLAHGCYAEGRFTHGVSGVVEHRRDVHALQPRGNLQSAQAGNGRVEIQQFDEGRADGRFLPRDADDERHPCRFVAQAHLGPEVVFAQVVAVVAGEDDNRPVLQAGFGEGV